MTDASYVRMGVAFDKMAKCMEEMQSVYDQIKPRVDELQIPVTEEEFDSAVANLHAIITRLTGV